MPAAERVFWRTDSATVWIGTDDDGALRFDGYDREYLDGYEYSITVAPDQFDALRRALRAEPDADVVDLLCTQVDEIMARGERTWLTDHGVDCRFSSY
jgi:hypothetical protein